MTEEEKQEKFKVSQYQTHQVSLVFSQDCLVLQTDLNVPNWQHLKYKFGKASLVLELFSTVMNSNSHRLFSLGGLRGVVTWCHWVFQRGGELPFLLGLYKSQHQVYQPARFSRSCCLTLLKEKPKDSTIWSERCTIQYVPWHMWILLRLPGVVSDSGCDEA